MKSLLFFVFILLCSCKKLKDIEADLGFDIDTGTLIDDLEKLQDKIKGCLYFNGINHIGFNKCCGPNFINVEKIFLGKYREQ